MAGRTNHPSEVISLRIPSRLEHLALLDRVTQSVCERLEFDEDTCSQVSMSVIEAGTNAIQHGHHKDPTKMVDIEFHLRPGTLEVLVHDHGKGFDIGHGAGDVTAPEHLFDARGRGIFIMRSCMDSVEFDFSNGGTRCRLVKHATRKAATATG
jgi:serine/threonine-protein kinase RsbW